MAWTLFGSNWLTGIICMWHGLIVDIPNGWALCDGTQGTPDMRERFVRGAANGINPGATGGTDSHKHKVWFHSELTDDEHTHEVQGQSYSPKSGDDDVADVDGDIMEYDVHEHEFEGEALESEEAHQHLIDDFTDLYSTYPPYYDILFIMKL